MLGDLLAYPLKLCGARMPTAAAIIIGGLALLVVVDIGFAELGYDTLNGDSFGSSAAKLYNLVGSIGSAFIGGCTLALALNHLGLRTHPPHVVDGLAMLALSIWYGVAVVLPFAVIALALSGGISSVAPEPYRLPAAGIVLAIVAVTFIYVTLRLFFAGPQTMVAGRIQLYRTWPLTKGKALPILGYGLAAIIAAILPALVYVGASLIMPAPDWIESWQDALLPWTFAHLVLNELIFVLATFYFSAASAFLFDRMMSPPATAPAN
jgi:hypothetical protein